MKQKFHKKPTTPYTPDFHSITLPSIRLRSS